MIIKVFYFTQIMVFMLLLRVKHTLCQRTRSSHYVVQYNIRLIKQINIGVLSIIISDIMKIKKNVTPREYPIKKITKRVKIDITAPIYTPAHFPSLIQTLQ